MKPSALLVWALFTLLYLQVSDMMLQAHNYPACAIAILFTFASVMVFSFGVASRMDKGATDKSVPQNPKGVTS